MTALPQPYVQSYSFTAFAQAQGNDAFPGVQVDLELQNLGQAISATAGFLATAFRSDGALANGSVTRDALASGIELGLNPPTVWTTLTEYEPGDAVTYGLGLYACQAEHLSGADFPGDLAAGFWSLVANFATMGLLAAGSVGPQQLAPFAVGAGALAANAVTTPTIAPGAVGRAALGPDVGQIPIGAELPWPGVRPPSGWLFEYGQAVSRATYAALLAVLTEATTCSPTQGSANLPVSEDLSALGLVGAAIEGPGVPIGAVIGAVTPAAITMATAAGAPATATATSAGTALTIFPWGNGDGATTFTLPDARGRVAVGRDDMGGAAANRLTPTMAGSLAAVGGASQHLLTLAEMPGHNHALTDPGHAHAVTDPGHTHSYQASNYFNQVSGSAYGSSAPTNSTTGSSKTGVTINSSGTGITIANSGGGGAHDNIQPSRVVNQIIFSGVTS